MAYIRTISPWHAQGDLRRVYQEIRHDMIGGRPIPLTMTIWNIMRVFSLRQLRVGRRPLGFRGSAANS